MTVYYLVVMLVVETAYRSVDLWVVVMVVQKDKKMVEEMVY